MARTRTESGLTFVAYLPRAVDAATARTYHANAENSGQYLQVFTQRGQVWVADISTNRAAPQWAAETRTLRAPEHYAGVIRRAAQLAAHLPMKRGVFHMATGSLDAILALPDPHVSAYQLRARARACLRALRAARRTPHHA